MTLRPRPFERPFWEYSLHLFLLGVLCLLPFAWCRFVAGAWLLLDAGLALGMKVIADLEARQP